MKKVVIISEKDYKKAKQNVDDAENKVLELIHLDNNSPNYKDQVNILSKILFDKVRNIEQLLSEKED